MYSISFLKCRSIIINSLDLWKELDKLLKTQKIPGITDGIAIFNSLIQQEAWTFSLSIDILPPPNLWASSSRFLNYSPFLNLHLNFLVKFSLELVTLIMYVIFNLTILLRF